MKWLPDEDNVIVQHYPTGGSKAVNDRLAPTRQRRAGAITKRAVRLGIKSSFRDRSKFGIAQDCSAEKARNNGDWNWNPIT